MTNIQYKLYKDKYIKEHGNSQGLRSLKNLSKEQRMNNKPLFFVSDFETTYHNESNSFDLLKSAGGVDNPVNLNVETPIHKYSKVFLIGTKEFKTSNYFVNYDLREWLNEIKNQCFKCGKNKCTISFHNLAYDGSYIRSFLVKEMNYKQTLNKNMKGDWILGQFQYGAVISQGKWFSLDFKWFGIKIHLVDMVKLAPDKLENIGMALGVNKLKDLVDYKDFEIRTDRKYPQIWLDYLYNDVEIMNQFYIKLESKSPTNLNKITIGQLAYDQIKKEVNEWNDKLKFKEYDYYYRGYSGGLCKPSTKYIGKWVESAKSNIKMIDAVSMYPSQMVKELPYKSINQQKSVNFTHYLEINIKEATIKDKYKDYPILKKPIFYTDENQLGICDTKDKDVSYVDYINQSFYKFKIIYYLWEDEWNLIQEFYDVKFKVIKKEKFYMSDYLKKGVDLLFLDKRDAKNESDKLLAKLVINNIYGKLGQNYDKTQLFIGEEKDIPKGWIIRGVVREETHNLGSSGFNVSIDYKQQAEESKDKAQPVYVASYVTMKARESLINKYLEIIKGGGVFLYCDTDSIVYIDKKDIKFNDIGKELGCWEYEANKKSLTKEKISVPYFCSLCPKQYRLVDATGTIIKHACAGVNKLEMYKVKNKDYNYDLQLNKLAHKAGKFGTILYDNPFSMEKYKGIIPNPKLPKSLKERSLI